jgi:threonine aldolase
MVNTNIQKVRRTCKGHGRTENPKGKKVVEGEKAMRMIDLRSDTVTQPTQAMRRAMMEAEVGDDGRVGPNGKGEDPTMNRLEEMAAKILGKERGLFMASGTMGNLVALMTHCRRGDYVAVGEKAHVYRTEKGPFLDDLYGLIPVTIHNPGGMLNLSLLEKALKGQPVRLVCVENTHGYSSGSAIRVEDLMKVRDLAKAHGVLVHMDGARIFNAAIALGTEAKVIAECADTVMFCLSKGLSSPIGSMLVGPEEFILRARERRKLIGGQMRQAGVIAAAGIEALSSMVGRLGDDHHKAKALAKALSGIEGLVIAEDVQTNMVKLDISSLNLTAEEFQSELAKRGVKVFIMSPTEIRLVTHKDISEEDCFLAAKIIGQFWKECRLSKI